MIIQERGQPRFLCRVEIPFRGYQKGDEILLTRWETNTYKKNIIILKTIETINELGIRK